MKIKKIISAVVLAGFLVSPVLVLAATAPKAFTNVGTLEAKLIAITDIVFTILLSIAGLFLIISGFFYITAAGDPEKIKKAKQMLINALIGVAIALAAKGIVNVLEDILKPV